jgi:hypothetical protein
MVDQREDVRTMLALAGISYRGINLILPERLRRQRLRILMDEYMSQCLALKDRWKIVWGPASFSAVSPGLDDALMYVAQDSLDPSILAVAIRGTNPISLSDWILGDFMVTHQVPWSYGSPAVGGGAMISMSTAFGLGILQHLRWSREIGPGSTAITPPPKSGASGTHALRPDSLAEWADLVKARLSSQAAVSLLETLAARLKDLGAADFNPLTLFKRSEAKRDDDSGTSLKDFLRTHNEDNKQPVIRVTGHSKGGTLSSTLALWLADSQGRQKDPDEEWDRDRKATIQCYSFAGPTAGNEEFAAHSDRVLRENCHRVWNKRDLAPYAFRADELEAISELYSLGGVEKRIVDGLIQAVADKVRPLKYQQICGDGMMLDCEFLPNLPFGLQIIHQHLDSYLADLGLSAEMSAASLLSPVL